MHWSEKDETILFGFLALYTGSVLSNLKHVRKELARFGCIDRSISALASRYALRKKELGPFFNLWSTLSSTEYRKMCQEKDIEQRKQQRKPSLEKYYRENPYTFLDEEPHQPHTDYRLNLFKNNVRARYKHNGTIEVNVRLTSKHPRVIFDISTELQDA